MSMIHPLVNSVGSSRIFNTTITFNLATPDTITIVVINHLTNTDKKANLERDSFAYVPIQFASEVEKVVCLLKNKHFEVIYKKNKDQGRLVSFSLMHPSLLTWEVIDEFSGSNGSAMCNYVSCIEISSTLQAFANLTGNIEIREKEKLKKLIPDSQIDEKCESRSLCLLSTGLLCERRYHPSGKNKIILWDWKKGRKFQEFVGYLGLLELSNKDLILFINNKLMIFRKKGKYKKIKEYKVPAWMIGSLFELENKKIIIVTLDKPTSFSFYKKCMIFDPVSGDLTTFNGLQSLTEIFPFSKGFIGVGKNPFLYNMQSNETCFLDLRGISSFCSLIDGTVALGCEDGKFSIYDIDGKPLYHTNFPSQILSIVELIDGSVTVTTVEKTFTLRPNKQQNNTEKKIAKLEMKVKQSPGEFSLYPKLAREYKKLNKTEEEYHLYLIGIESAAKCSNYYKARRFFEQAAALYPEKKKPYFVYINQLDCQNHLRRTAFLQLYKLLNRQMEELSANYIRKQAYIQKFVKKSCELSGCEKMLREIGSSSCKTRLIIGESNFTYTESLIHEHFITHSELASSIIATALVAPTDVTTLKRVDSLREKGVAIQFNVEAKEINNIFLGKRIERIHWNCLNEEGTSKEKGDLKKIIIDFFKSGSELQEVGDRIHITLFQDPANWTTSQIESGIVKAATLSEYRLIRKRLFQERCLIDSKKREFVFEKLDGGGIQLNLQINAQNLCDPGIKPYSVGVEEKSEENLFFECSTDEDSSEYFADESDEIRGRSKYANDSFYR